MSNPGAPQTGRYLLTNLEFATVASLRNASAEQALTSNPGGPNAAQNQSNLWDVVTFINGRSTIRNHLHGSYATTGNDPRVRSPVLGNLHEQQWLIEPVTGTGVPPNTYTISTAFSNDNHIWGLRSEQVNSEIQLSDNGEEARNQWVFTSI